MDSQPLVSLLSGIVSLDPIYDREITGIALDSREVEQGFLFLAYPGTHADGRAYILDAIAQGAAAILAEADYDFKALPQSIPLFQSSHVGHMASKIAARFYAHPSRAMHIIGVTGTNGKTSIAYFLAQALDKAPEQAVYIGTLGVGAISALHPSTHTTPDPIILQKNLASFLKQGVKHVAMEVSSHALSQGRVQQVEFETAIFTNLTHDHLDYHKTMTSYGEAKASLFHQFGLRNAVINLDDPWGRKIYADLAPSIKPLGYSLHLPEAPIYAEKYCFSAQGISATVHTPWGTATLENPLLGAFNLSNLLAVLATLLVSGYTLPHALERIAQLPSVPGRMEVMREQGSPTFVIDYAHTPDALEKALQTVRQVFSGSIWCVFGCGGERDRSKRPEMGAIAEKYADHIVLTNDNPRTEDPENIMAEIALGIQVNKQVQYIPNRKEAIQYAYSHAGPQDLILVAGKGHEEYQDLGGKKTYFSDRTLCRKLLEAEGSPKTRFQS